MKIKKIPLSLGTITTVLIPVVTVIACGQRNNKEDNTKDAKTILDSQHDQTDVNQEAKRIKELNPQPLHWTSYYFIKSNTLTKEQLNLEPKKGFKYEITHIDITQDGEVEIEVKVIKNESEAIARKKVQITGIDEMKENDQKKVDAEVSRIEQLSKEALSIKTPFIETVSLTEQELNFTPNDDFTYEIIPEIITMDGDFLVNIKITKGLAKGDATRQIQVTGIDQAKQDQNDVDAEVARIEQLSREVLTKTTDIQTDSLTEQELNFVPNTNFTYEITHEAITSDGDFVVNIKVKKGVAKGDATRQIQVAGIVAP